MGLSDHRNGPKLTKTNRNGGNSYRNGCVMNCQMIDTLLWCKTYFQRHKLLKWVFLIQKICPIWFNKAFLTVSCWAPWCSSDVTSSEKHEQFDGTAAWTVYLNKKLTEQLTLMIIKQLNLKTIKVSLHVNIVSWIMMLYPISASFTFCFPCFHFIIVDPFR